MTRAPASLEEAKNIPLGLADVPPLTARFVYWIISVIRGYLGLLPSLYLVVNIRQPSFRNVLRLNKYNTISCTILLVHQQQKSGLTMELKIGFVEVVPVSASRPWFMSALFCRSASFGLGGVLSKS